MQSGEQCDTLIRVQLPNNAMPVDIMVIGNALYSAQLFQAIKRYAFNNSVSCNLGFAGRTFRRAKLINLAGDKLTTETGRIF